MCDSWISPGSSVPLWHLPQEQHFSPAVWSLIGFMCRVLLPLVTSVVIKEKTLCSFHWKHNIGAKVCLPSNQFQIQTGELYFLWKLLACEAKKTTQKTIKRKRKQSSCEVHFKWCPYVFVLFTLTWSKKKKTLQVFIPAIREQDWHFCTVSCWEIPAEVICLWPEGGGSEKAGSVEMWPYGKALIAWRSTFVDEQVNQTLALWKFPGEVA